MRASEDVSRILVVELWKIGDVVLTIPFLAQLRAVFPNARITMLGQPHARLILEGTALVDEFIEADLAWSRTRRVDPFTYRWREFVRVVFELRRRKFDVAFQSRRHIREQVLLALAGVGRRVGYARGAGRKFLTYAGAPPNAERQKADEWLELLAPFAGEGDRAANVVPPRLKIAESERRWADSYLLAHGVSSTDILVGIHPGASVPEKRWPLDRFREVTNFVAQRSGRRALIFVDPSGYGAALGEADGVISAKVDLRRMMALLDRCAILVCNDSGPMHLAAGLGVPTVAMFGSGISRSFAPLGDGHELLTAAQTRASGENVDAPPRPYDVSEISTSKVLDAIERALSRAISNAETREQARILLSHGRQ
jgi:ADP-heptose:LPS heptosyltransferase